MNEIEGLEDQNFRVQGTSDQESGNRWAWTLVVALFYGIGGGIVGASVFGPSLHWLLFSISVTVTAVLGMRVSKLRLEGWKDLRHAHRMTVGAHNVMGDKLEAAEKALACAKEFIATFPVAPPRINDDLVMSAKSVESALQAKVAFYQGRERWILETPTGDPELDAALLQRKYEARENELELNVKRLLAEFQRKLDLAREQSRPVYDSWKIYAGIQSPGVEGKNEPPGQ